MKITLMIVLLMMSFPPSSLKLDFGKNKTQNDWYVVNDGVMGGRSQSRIDYTSNSMVFSGRVSLENNGGFASMRSPYKSYQLNKYEGIRMRVKSATGRKFSFVLEKNTPWFMPTYKHDFQLKKDQWTTIDMPIKEFYETRIGNPTGKKIKRNDMDDIERLGIILYDKQAGEFKLEVDYVELY